MHILAEYPKPSPEDPEVTMIAFYLSLPPEVSQGTVVSRTILTTIVESNMKTIGRSMNSTIVNVEHLRQTSKTTFQTNESEGNHTGAIAGGVVGGCLFLFVIGALLVVYLRKRRYVLKNILSCFNQFQYWNGFAKHFGFAIYVNFPKL